MAYLVGVLVLVVGVLVSIALHEVGHMVPAKRFGVRVSQFMVGFGPTLWSRTRGETEYGFKAIPLGGYVRLVGMFATAEAVGARPRTGRLAELAQATREASAEEIHPGEDHRAFFRLSTPKKLVVMLGGPVMNLLIAIVLIGVVLVGIGLPGGASTTVATVSQCVVPLDADPDRECTAQDPAAPAAAAGIEPGDRVVAFGGAEIATWTELETAIRASGGIPVSMVVEREGQQVRLEVVPLLAERPVYDEQREPVLGADGEPLTDTVGFLGVGPAPQLERQPLSAVPSTVGTVVWETVKIVATLPVHVAQVAQSTFGGGTRDGSGVVGVVGIGRFAGEIAADESPGFGLAERVASMLLLLASLNVALFAFNLIPLLPLDGGHVAGALWEGGRRQLARWRGVSLPGPADVARMMPLAYGVFAVLAVVMVLLVYADLVRPITF
ncbi:RIP metalloprotease [Actinotalea sp. K2]|uniref:M50 family metallopeptidase n=1 Tax=Actinotalea sp. K2 TaxID=2939438 RepID=UPI002017C336|nr:site-2 protease family protein [Actinotalea sp. K2]MCL3860211.1 site-2 protease family protein [Actinotalea sp. K2]